LQALPYAEPLCSLAILWREPYWRLQDFLHFGVFLNSSSSAKEYKKGGFPRIRTGKVKRHLFSFSTAIAIAQNFPEPLLWQFSFDCNQPDFLSLHYLCTGLP
jgi:hypothetical protein